MFRIKNFAMQKLCIICKCTFNAKNQLMQKADMQLIIVMYGHGDSRQKTE